MAYTKSEKPEGQARRRGGMHARRRKVCVFCGKDNVIDYKDAANDERLNAIPSMGLQRDAVLGERASWWFL